jgi:TRAP-type transport system small permease protein
LADPRGRGAALALRRVAEVGAVVAGTALAAMMLLTVADVTLRGLLAWPIRGTFELVELGLAATFFLALPLVFLRDENIVVDSIDYRMPRVVPLLRRIAGVVSAVVLALMTWQALIGARDSLVFGDVSADLALPQLVYWIPVVLGLAGALIAALLRATRGSEA